MKKTILKKEILEIVFSKLNKDNCIVFLFGSHATGENIKSSDVDVGILCDKSIDSGVFLEIQQKLNEEINTLHEIDFVDFSTVSEIVKNEALKEVNVWHTGKNCRDLLKSLNQH